MLKYIAKTFNLGTMFWKNFKDNIVGYFNSNYTGLIDKRKSTEVYIFVFLGVPISYSLKLQLTISLLSFEVKYRILIKTGKKAV